MVRGRALPSVTDFQKYAVNLLGTTDVVYAPLYDFQLYAAAGQNLLTFFAIPQGQGATSHPGGAGVKTLADTNMTLAGQIPAPQRFMVIGVELVLLPSNLPGRGPVAQTTVGFNANDVYSVARSGSLTLTIGQKIYAQDAPMMAFAQQNYLEGLAAVSDATTAGANLLSQVETASIRGPAYAIQPTVIPNGQNFNVQAVWPNLIALPSAGAATRIGVKLLGWLARAAQ